MPTYRGWRMETLVKMRESAIAKVIAEVRLTGGTKEDAENRAGLEIKDELWEDVLPVAGSFLFISTELDKYNKDLEHSFEEYKKDPCPFYLGCMTETINSIRFLLEQKEKQAEH